MKSKPMPYQKAGMSKSDPKTSRTSGVPMQVGKKKPMGKKK
jgi:hypothetical protein